MRCILFLAGLRRGRFGARGVEFGEHRHEFAGQRVIAGHQRVGRAVAHLFDHEPVLLAGLLRPAQIVHAQSPAHGGLGHAQPGGNVRDAPAKQPDEAELAQRAFAVRAKAPEASGWICIGVFHAANYTSARYPAGFAGRDSRWPQGWPVAFVDACATCLNCH